MLHIEKLSVFIKEKQGTKIILSDFNLKVRPNEVHAIMGPNGSGKSTLSRILAGDHHAYHLSSGNITFCNDDLLALTPEELALRGVFLAFQHPVEIPGVNNMYFLRTALNALRTRQQLPLMDAADFFMLMQEKIKAVGLPDTFLQRALNEGFSGGEKKRNEILQALILEPRLLILDEIDSGLDVDALQSIAKAINTLRHPKKSIIMITHYQRLLDYVQPDIVHILINGKIVQSGDCSLAKMIEKNGYADWLNYHDVSLKVTSE